MDRTHALHEKLIRHSKSFQTDLTVCRELSQKKMNFDRINDLPKSLKQDSEFSNYVERVVSREWYKQGFFVEHFIEERFYYCFVAYICITIFVGAVVMFLLEPGLEFMDALFSAACSVTQSGLASVDWHKLGTQTHVVSLILILLGSMPLLTLVPVLLRRQSFRRQSEWEQKACEEASGASEIFRTAFEERLRKRQSLEYMALGKVLKIVLGFIFMAQLTGFLVIYIFAVGDAAFLRQLENWKVGPAWHSFYLVVSSFQNNGLTLMPNSVESLNRKPVPLMASAMLILVGNTCFAICIRLIASVMLKCTRKDSQDRKAYTFLLEHPRRCFTHLFPPEHTLWLCIVLFSLTGSQIACFLIEEWNSAALDGMGAWDKLWNAVYQGVTSRTAGLNSVDINGLSAATTFLMCVCMYISTSPTVVTMRLSSLIDEVDITGHLEGVDDSFVAGFQRQESKGGTGKQGPGPAGTSSVRDQARRYLLQDVTYLVLMIFFILVFEKSKLDASIQSSCRLGTSGEAYQAYGDFSVYKVVFEVISAYGTVGLSLGFRRSPASFSGSWTRTSQLLLIFAMVLGRLRGLPDSIDPSVSFTMSISGKRTGFVRMAASNGSSQINTPMSASSIVDEAPAVRL